MATNGVFRTVLSDKEGKKASESVITKAFDNANKEAINCDPKNGKKAKGC